MGHYGNYHICNSTRPRRVGTSVLFIEMTNRSMQHYFLIVVILQDHSNSPTVAYVLSDAAFTL